MVIFNSYVSLPEGIPPTTFQNGQRNMTQGKKNGSDHGMGSAGHPATQVAFEKNGLKVTFHPRKDAETWPWAIRYSFWNRYIWVNYNLTATSLEVIVSKGNHPQMALIQVSEILWFTHIYI